MLLKLALKKRKVINPSENDDWIETVAYYRMRDKEYGDENKWCRTEMKGNTIDLMYYIFSVSLNDEESFESELAKKIKYLFDVTRNRKTNATGQLALNYVRNLHKGNVSGLGHFCLKKSGTDPSKTEKIITNEIHNFWKHGYSL